MGSLKIGHRLGLALMSLTLATVAIIVLVNFHTQKNIISVAEQRELRAYSRQLEASLDGEARRALSLADQVAGVPEAQAAFSVKDRKRLEALFAEL